LITNNEKLSPVNRILSRALDTETGKMFLNDLKGVLSKVVIIGSIVFTVYLIVKFNSWLSRNENLDNEKEV